MICKWQSWVLIVTLVSGLTAHAETAISFKARRDLTYGAIAYTSGNPIDYSDFQAYGIYRQKDHCWTWGYPDAAKSGVIRRGEVVALIPFSDATQPDRITLKISRADGTQIASFSCQALDNPAPETEDDLKAFLQIQFGASATIQ